MLNNKHGWECAEAYSRNPVADNSDDDKKIKKALKEAESVKEEKLKAQRASRINSKKGISQPCSVADSCCPVNPEYNFLLPMLLSARAFCQYCRAGL